MNLGPLARGACVGGAWAMLCLASPGVFGGDGSALLAILALVPWGLAASRPGKKAFLVEWLAAAIGLSVMCWWTTYVLAITLLAVAIVPAFYMACAGALLRRLARSVPLCLALPAAWVSLETLRAWVEPPLGFGWLRLGHFTSHVPWIAGSARVWGVMGLSFAAAGCAGVLSEFVRARFRMTAGSSAPTADGQAARSWIAWVLASGPLALAPVLSLATSPPPMVDGPRLLLVQPSFEQHRKMENTDTWPDLLALTKKSAAEAQPRAGRPAVDLVCWGESLLPFDLASEDLQQAWDRGLRPPSWDRTGLSELHRMVTDEQSGVREVLFGRKIVPAGSAFLAGMTLYLPRGGELRRTTGAMLWGADGKRLGWGAKKHLVPGGETMVGLERWAWVRDAAFELAGYVPDLVAAEETGVVELPLQGARPVRLGLTICFDNTFDDPYTEPLRRGPLDAHVVLSNEAWYEESFEYDHMLAFTRLAAIESGRAIARVTNSGVSCLFGADGAERDRLRVGGKDRMVGGSLLVDLPIPAPGHAADRTPYVSSEPLLRWMYVLFPLLLLALWRPRPVTPSA